MTRRLFTRRFAALGLSLLLIASALPLTALAAYENTHVNTGNQATDLVSVALTQVGYTEGSNNANKYAESYGNANQPWCGYFISWCARQAGIPTAVIPNTGSSAAFKTIGTYHARGSGYTPQPGDILMYDYDGDGSPEHVSIVEKYTASTNTVSVVDGNWSDKVSYHTASMTDTNVLGFTTPPYTTKITELTAINLVTPSIVLKGSSFSVGGVIYSDVNITSVSITVQDASGNTKISASASPNAKSYDLKGLDAQIRFGSLDVGEFSYVIAATDSSGDTKRWTTVFEVVTTVPMTITDVVAPMVLPGGKSFSISGTVSCIENLSTVSVGVYDEAGTYKTGATANPNATSYDIKGIDNYVSFGSLTSGYYTMRVSARSVNGSATWEYPFTVGITTAFSVADIVAPTTLTVGENFTVGGVVTSTTPFATVSINILDASGTRIAYAYTTPHAYSVDISAMADDLDFSVLAAGDYTFRIGMLSGDVNESVLYPFTVKEASAFTAENIVVPTELTVGEHFTIGGTVTSPTPFTTVSINILDADGNRIQFAGVDPNTCTVDIGTMAQELDFSVLEIGDYTFRIGLLTAAAHEERLYPFTVVDVPFVLHTSAYPTVLLVGDDYTISGTVTGRHILDAVTIGVLDADGNTVFEATANPAAYTYAFSALASAMDFDSLDVGQYTFRVGVRSGTERDEWLYTFHVVEAPATNTAGDVTLDGTINMRDVMVLYSHVSGANTMSDAQLTRVGTDVVNMATALRLYRFVSGASDTYL